MSSRVYESLALGYIGMAYMYALVSMRPIRPESVGVAVVLALLSISRAVQKEAETKESR